jgi:hypothetical protein
MNVKTTHATELLVRVGTAIASLAATGGLSLLLVLAQPTPAAAQDGSTPAAPGTTHATECTVTPRPIDDFLAAAEATPGVLESELRGLPAATPAPPSAEGTPANQEIVDALTATIEQSVACLNAGDLPRLFALYTDEAFIRSLGGGIAVTPDVAQQAAELATPRPLPSNLQQSIPSIGEVRLLPDGRVTAITATEEGRTLVVFAKEGGRYLIDWVYELPHMATPTGQ